MPESIAAAAAETTPPQHPPGTWFSPARGATIGSGEVLDHAARMSAVLLGETHDRPEIHRWQLHVTAALRARGRPIAVGFEMFPVRLQPALDRWVAGELDTESFLVESEWFDVWGFDPELYLPIFQFCRQQRVPMLALNCYRALVTRVRKEGWAAIPEAERDGLTPSAPPTDGYRGYLQRLMGGMRGGGAQIASTDFDGFIAAQQTWDRAFAENIAKALRVPDPPLVIGIIGRGHLEFGHGTPYQLRDLGVNDVAVLLTANTRDASPWALEAGIGDAVFRIDEPEPPPPLPVRYGFGVAADADGLVIAAVDSDTPAAAAGLSAGDRITAIRGRPVTSKAALTGVLRRVPPGAVLPIAVIRNGTALECLVRVPLTPPPRLLRPGERPAWPR